MYGSIMSSLKPMSRSFVKPVSIERKSVKMQQKNYTKEQLKEQLREMGIEPTDALMVHSSMKSLGAVEGGADTVIDALMEAVSRGLLMMPTHTWKCMGPAHNLFDPKKEPCCVGIIPELFRKRPGVVRSLHPTHSIAVYGAMAEEYVKGEETAGTPCPPGGCWDRLRDIHAKILLVGVTHARNTFIHSIEEVFDVPERFSETPIAYRIKMPDGTEKSVQVYKHYNPYMEHISESFDKMKQGYYDTGAARKAYLGDAECILCDAEKMFEVTGRILTRYPNCFIECDIIPREWYLGE